MSVYLHQLIGSTCTVHYRKSIFKASDEIICEYMKFIIFKHISFQRFDMILHRASKLSYLQFSSKFHVQTNKYK